MALIIALRVSKEGHETSIEETGIRQSLRVILTVEELFRIAKERQKKLWLTCANVVVKVKFFSISIFSSHTFTTINQHTTCTDDYIIFFVASMAPTSSGLRRHFQKIRIMVHRLSKYSAVGIVIEVIFPLAVYWSLGPVGPMSVVHWHWQMTVTHRMSMIRL